jgi:hypothetical protein
MIFLIVLRKRHLKAKLKSAVPSRVVSRTPSITPQPNENNSNTVEQNQMMIKSILKKSSNSDLRRSDTPSILHMTLESSKHTRSFKYLEKRDSVDDTIKRVQSWPYCMDISNETNFMFLSTKKADLLVVEKELKKSIDLHRSRTSREAPIKKKSVEHVAMKRTLILTISFIVFWLPFVVIQFLIAISAQKTYLLSNLNLISIGISLCHSSVNPLIYCLTNFELLNAMKRHLRRFFPRSNRSQTNQIVFEFL